MKRLFIAVCLALAGVGALAFYYWQQATQLPAWYTDSQTNAVDRVGQTATTAPTVAAAPTRPSDRPAPSQPASAQPNTAASPPKAATTNVKASAAPKPPTKTELHQRELTQLFTTAVTRKAESKQLGRALKGAKTTIENGTVESGAVVNLGAIAPEQLPPDERAFFTKLLAAFPELSHQNFYIGIEGKPTVKDGQAQLNDDVRVRLGNLSFTPAQLSERLGIPEDQIRQQIQLQVQLGNLNAKQLQLADDRPTDEHGSN